jgi:thiamine-monophosphate kinase
MTTHTSLGAGREFDAIRAMLDVWGPRARGIGDDAAIVAVPAGEQLVVSTDTSVDNVHFRRTWISARDIGYRATMAALSDLAAMGARPLGVLLAMVVPEADRAALVEYAAGVGDAVADAETVIVGGDISAGATLSLGLTVLGAAARPLTRGGARHGDAIWVTGALGGPGAAVAAWEQGGEPSVACRARFARPCARVAAGQLLGAAGATATVDLSDGLVADLRHIAHASGVHATIALEHLPVLAGCTLRGAALSGEEYELVFTAGDGFDAQAFTTATGLPVTRIGHIDAGAPGVTVTEHGVRVEISGGHDHFSV